MRKMFLNTFKLKFLYAILVSLAFVYSNSIYGQEKKCVASLNFDNDIQNKTATLSGTSYKLELLNKGNQKTIFIIGVENEVVLAKSNSKYRLSRFSLNNEILDKDFNNVKSNDASKKHSSFKSDAISHEVSLAKDETFEFYINQKIAAEAKVGSKNVSKVSVTSPDCLNFRIEKLLETEITNCCDE